MIPREDWLEAAKALPVGTRRKIAHTCGEGKPLLIGHEPMFYWAKCFREGVGDRVDKELTAEEKLAMLQADSTMQALAEASTVELPPAATRTLSKAALVYLGLRGITSEVATSRGVMYDQESNRLIMPIVHQFTGELQAYTARDLNYYDGQKTEGRPKFIYNGPDRQHMPLTVVPCSNPVLNALVVTEDLLSAWAVSRACDSAPLNGTSITDLQLQTIMQYDDIVMWLDGDEPGQEGAAAVIKKAELLGKRVWNVKGPVDPKYYSLSTLLEVLGGKIGGRETSEDSQIQGILSAIGWASRPNAAILRDTSVTGGLR